MKKPKYFKNETVFQIAIPVAITSLIILANYVYSKLANDLGMILVVINILIGLLLFLFVQYRFQKKLNLGNRYIVKAIDAVRENDDKKNDTPENLDFSEIYTALDELSQNLKKRDKNRLEVLNIVNSVASNMELEKFLEALMPRLLEILKSNWGAFYLANNATNKLEIKSSVGFGKNIYAEFDLTIGEGFIGAAALKREAVILKDIPDDTVYVTKTFLGELKPKNLMLVPIINQDQLMGVLALGSIYEYTNNEMELVNLIKYYIGAAVGNGVIYERSKRLTNELRFQNKLIQDLNSDLETKINERNLFLNNMMNSIKDYAIYSMDKDGMVLTWNTGAELLFEYNASEIVGKNISFIYPADDIERGLVRRRIDEVLKNGKFTEEGWRKKRDGTIYYVDVSIFAMYNQNGDIIGMTNVTKDITELKTIQDDLMLEKELSNKLFEHCICAGLVVNYNLVIESANQKAHELFMYTTIEGKKLSSIFDDVVPVIKYFNSLEGSASFEITTIKNNTVFKAEIIGISDGTGHFIKALLILK